jgi:hypothetical protein
MHTIHIFPPYFHKILAPYERLELPSVLFPSGIPTKILYSLLISHKKKKGMKICNIKFTDASELVVFWVRLG